ncbi:MAG TPA: fibrobacter succinogenes major paralogous domain-containing protein [Bacteroidales bacterium]|nr:fibrobacter succinogenes major paralogous domain-containing protein [Bacteroidales bacterium]HOE04805.1 fibrobacter succinogenes major paralogous domain-containing protein [Bacteroidales bacterium]HQL71343.1 fibrobacter succinogenes major paralogous domain-containing protein [Bacteroidales bacterium]
MKKILSLCLGLLIAAGVSLAQETMFIYTKDGNVTKIAVSSIEKITFSGDNSLPVTNTVTDADGNVYRTLTIGHQVWLAENLKTTKYNDGTPIALITDYEAWGKQTTGSYCWYMNNSDNKNVYGGLYNWHAVNTGKLCPKGWHVPVAQEFAALVGAVNSDGSALKESGTAHWKDNPEKVSNSTGFTALPAGRREDKSFAGSETSAFFWTSNPNGENEAFYYTMWNTSSLFIKYASKKTMGYSVRCVRD